MATRFYLPVGGSPPTLPAFTSSWESSVSAQRWPAVRSKSNTALTQYVKRFPSATTQQMLFHQWISETLDVDQAISGTISMVVKTYEANAAVDSHLAFVVKVMQGDSTTLVRGTLLQYHATSTEKTTAWQTRIHSARAITTVNALAGDRIVIEIGSHGVTPSTSYDDGLKFGDPSATADYALTSGLTTDLCPWVQLNSVTLTFGTPPITITGAGNIATAEAHGTPSDSATAAPSGLATAEAHGAQNVGATTAPSAIAGAEAFGTALLELDDSANVLPEGIATEEAHGTPSASVNAALSGIATAEAAGSPGISPVAAPAGIVSGEAIGSPATSPSLSASGIATAEAMGSPAAGPVAAPAGIASLEAHGSPAASLTVSTPAIPGAEAFGNPGVAASGNLLGVGGIASEEHVGSPKVSYTLVPGLPVGGAADAMRLRLLRRPVEIGGAGGIISGEAFGAPDLSTSLVAFGTDGRAAFGKLALSLGPHPRHTKSDREIVRILQEVA